MYLVELNIILSSCFYFSNAFGLYGLGNGYRFFIKELNSTIGLFDSAPISTKWIRQPLDHFKENETRTWKMRYFERRDYWKPKGPIYLFINGEGPASQVFLQTGILYELAKETKGAMYLSEHRYYGKSKPFKVLSTENLTYLSSRQALADIAKLLKIIKMSPKYNESKVVVVGGSYAGNLAAWMRLLYPNLIDAAIASSAPVLAKKDFYEYLENVSDDFEQHGTPGCFGKIKKIFNRYDTLFKTSSGIEQLKKEEQICESTDMDKLENKQLFFLDKTSEFMYEAQYGNPESIKDFCDDLTNTLHVVSTKDDESDLWNEKNNCFDYDFDAMIESIMPHPDSREAPPRGSRHEAWRVEAARVLAIHTLDLFTCPLRLLQDGQSGWGMREIDWIMAWTYQTCTEFGYFPSTNSDEQPFTNNINVELFYSLCTKTYGDDFDEKRIDEGIERSNIMYGGLEPNVTQVVFVNGDLDPYHKLGVLEDVSYEAPAKIIPLSSHCRDLFSDKSKDPEELKEARKYVKYLIKRWIGAGEYKRP